MGAVQDKATVIIVYGFAVEGGDLTEWAIAPKLPEGWTYDDEGEGDGCECGDEDKNCIICQGSGFGANSYPVYGKSTEAIKQTCNILDDFFTEQKKKGKIKGFKISIAEVLPDPGEAQKSREMDSSSQSARPLLTKGDPS
jgi:hypothetical protein